MNPGRTIPFIIVSLSMLLAGRTFGEEPASKVPPLPKSHTTRQLEGWTVRVDDRLLSGDGAAAGERALKLLSVRLYLIMSRSA